MVIGVAMLSWMNVMFVIRIILIITNVLTALENQMVVPLLIIAVLVTVTVLMTV